MSPATDGPPVAQKLVELLILFAGVLLTCMLLSVFTTTGIRTFVMLTAAVLVIIWTFMARDLWWVLLPLTLSFGGFFYFGFKIMNYELGLLLCLFPLVFTLAVGKAQLQGRKPLPFAVYALLIYVSFHMLISVYLLRNSGLGGTGNLIRVYIRALWPLIFLVPFYLFGKTTHLPLLLRAMYIVTLIRVCLGLTGLLFPQFLAIPGINFVLPAIDTEGKDLRASALMFVPLSICQASLAKSRGAALFHMAVIAAAGVFILAGGSRVSLLMFCVLPLFWAIMRRRFVLVSLLGLTLAVAVLAFNSNPQILYRFPFRVRRALSVVVLDTPYHNIHKSVRGSNVWHFRLIETAQEQWLHSPRTFAIGNRVYPFSEEFLARTSRMEDRIEIAAGMGTYESGLWTTLAVLGATGLLLYLVVFWKLMRPIVPVLRREGICDAAHAFYFLAAASLFTWLLFSWIAGHFPSWQLMMAALARATFEDERRRQTDTIDQESAPTRADADPHATQPVPEEP